MRMFLVLLTCFSLFSKAFTQDVDVAFSDKKEELFRQDARRIISRICAEYEKNEIGKDVGFSKERAEEFFSLLHDEYLEKMNEASAEYFTYFGIKGIISSLKFQDQVNQSYFHALKIRDEYFKSVLDLCGKYPDEELGNTLKVQIEHIVKNTLASDWEDFMFLNFGKTSKLNLDTNEFFQNLFLEKTIKIFMIENLFDYIEQMRDDWEQNSLEEIYEKIFSESFFITFLELLKKSENKYLTEIFDKYHLLIPTEDFIESKFHIPLLKDPLSLDFINSNFKNDLIDLQDNYIDDLDDCLEICIN